MNPATVPCATDQYLIMAPQHTLSGMQRGPKGMGEPVVMGRDTSQGGPFSFSSVIGNPILFMVILLIRIIKIV